MFCGTMRARVTPIFAPGIWNLTLESLMDVTLGVKSPQESIKTLSRYLVSLVFEIMALLDLCDMSMSQTGVSILGGFRAVKSERKVRFGQTWWQSKGLMEYYHIKLFKRQSRPFIKPQNPRSSKISDITFKLLLLYTKYVFMAPNRLECRLNTPSNNVTRLS